MVPVAPAVRSDVVEIARVHLDDAPAHVPGLRIPADVVAYLEFRHGVSSMRACELATAAVHMVSMLEFAVVFPHPNAMIELNPVRARIADLTGRLDALRGYL